MGGRGSACSTAAFWSVPMPRGARCVVCGTFAAARFSIDPRCACKIHGACHADVRAGAKRLLAHCAHCAEGVVADSRQVLAKTGALRHAKVATVPPSEGEDGGQGTIRR